MARRRVGARGVLVAVAIVVVLALGPGTPAPSVGQEERAKGAGRLEPPPRPEPPADPVRPVKGEARGTFGAGGAAANGNGNGAPSVGRGSMLRLVSTGNPMLWPLGLCSIVALGFALERLLALRRDRVIPRDFVGRFLERLATGKLDRERAIELCKANDSPVSRIFAHAVRYWGQPAATIRQAIGFDAAGELAELKRNVRVLNGTATMAPLLGLLGTVIGMVEAFDALGVAGHGGAGKGELLAHGISLALMTTALGLAIAVVSVAAYYYLLNRIDTLVRELDEQTLRVIDLVAEGTGRPSAPGGGVTERWTTLLGGDVGRDPQSRTLGRADPIRSEPL